MRGSWCWVYAGGIIAISPRSSEAIPGEFRSIGSCTPEGVPAKREHLYWLAPTPGCTGMRGPFLGCRSFLTQPHAKGCNPSGMRGSLIFCEGRIGITVQCYRNFVTKTQDTVNPRNSCLLSGFFRWMGLAMYLLPFLCLSFLCLAKALFLAHISDG